jgi:hypothetical protein
MERRRERADDDDDDSGWSGLVGLAHHKLAAVHVSEKDLSPKLARGSVLTSWNNDGRRDITQWKSTVAGWSSQLAGHGKQQGRNPRPIVASKALLLMCDHASKPSYRYSSKTRIFRYCTAVGQLMRWISMMRRTN